MAARNTSGYSGEPGKQEEKHIRTKAVTLTVEMTSAEARKTPAGPGVAVRGGT